MSPSEAKLLTLMKVLRQSSSLLQGDQVSEGLTWDSAQGCRGNGNSVISFQPTWLLPTPR